MNSPYSLPVAELENLLARGQSILEKLGSTKKGRGYIGIGREAAEKWKLMKPGTIKKIARGLNDISNGTEAVIEVETSRWMQELQAAIADLHTGQRKYELRRSRKKTILKEFGQVTKRRSTRGKVNAGIALAVSVLSELRYLDLNWVPRGKLIPAGRLLRGKEELEEILKALKGSYAMVCDPYCSSNTLTVLESIPSDLPLTVLTVNIADEKKFIDAARILKGKGRNITVAVVPKTSRDKPHDRFIVTDSRGWQMGASIKDIGNKDTNIHELSNLGQIQAMFDHYLSGNNNLVSWLHIGTT